MTSKALYKKLADVLILPSVRRLQQLSSGTSVATNTIDMDYLQCRTAALKEHEKIVVLLIDEVYTARRVECVSGKLVGLTEDGEISKTVLTFMVQSLRAKFKDVVQLVPLAGFSCDVLEMHFIAVLSTKTRSIPIQLLVPVPDMLLVRKKQINFP